jgi:hypothetical protein
VFVVLWHGSLLSRVDKSMDRSLVDRQQESQPAPHFAGTGGGTNTPGDRLMARPEHLSGAVYIIGGAGSGHDRRVAQGCRYNPQSCG